MEEENTLKGLISVSFEAVKLSEDAIKISLASPESFMIVKNLASFNDQNKKVESSAEIYRDQSLV